MTNIHKYVEHYEAQDRERKEFEDKIALWDLNSLIMSTYKSEPDDEFRDVYFQRCDLLRQYREKFGEEAYLQLRGQLYKARKDYIEQFF